MRNRTQQKGNACIACQGSDIEKFIELQDYFLSQEWFEIHRCNQCGLMFTLPQPSIIELPTYYQSKKYFSHMQRGFSVTQSIYNAARNFMIRRKVSVINKFAYRGSVLDIGCGTGEFLAACMKNGWNTTGIEPNSHARKYANSEYGLNIYDDTYLDQCSENSMDVVTMWHSLEHTRNPQGYFDAIQRILKPHGLLLLALPNTQSWDAQHYDKYWAAWDVPRHLHHFSQNAIEVLAKKNNFILTKVIPLPLDAFYVSLLSEKYRNAKSTILKAFVNGWRSNIEAKNKNIGYSSQIYLFKHS
ncbi:MAG: class I SAM-dependent methyltransferase [Bacteroidales bacterium]|nr:class I SAM-dependent methyltransferase [Bacteroidales bacterium]MDZ4205354.1 class I SAM-dependent methyltransferase [Bacteroidales bacterium]